MANKDVSPASYLKFREFLEKQCGIVLGDNKQYLVRSRLASLLYKHKYESADELIDVVVKGFDRTLLQNVIDAMTTNETLWLQKNNNLLSQRNGQSIKWFRDHVREEYGKVGISKAKKFITNLETNPFAKFHAILKKL